MKRAFIYHSSHKYIILQVCCKGFVVPLESCMRCSTPGTNMPYCKYLSVIHVAFKSSVRAGLSCTTHVTSVHLSSHTYIMCIIFTFKCLAPVACVQPFSDASWDRPRRPFENVRFALCMTFCVLATSLNEFKLQPMV